MNTGKQSGQSGLIPRLRDRFRRATSREDRNTTEIVRPNPPTEMDAYRLVQQLMLDPLRELASYFDRDTWLPSFDVSETSDSLLFAADVPGIQQNELEISVTGNRLQIAGTREIEHPPEETLYTRERMSGTFVRSFALPENVDIDHVSSRLRDGVLTIVVPKLTTSRARRIPIGSASGA